MVEHLVANERVAGSNLVSRSNFLSASIVGAVRFHGHCGNALERWIIRMWPTIPTCSIHSKIS